MIARQSTSCGPAAFLLSAETAAGLFAAICCSLGMEMLRPGVSTQSLVTAIGLGAYATAVSPISSVGTNVLANYGTVYNPSEEEQKKVFNGLLIFAVIGWFTFTLAALLGLYGIHLFS